MSAAPEFRDEEREVADLVPAAHNSRHHSEEQVVRMMRSIEEFGWTHRVLIDEADGIIAGHRRVLAASRLALVRIPVRVAIGWTEEQKRAYLIADNRLAEGSSWDESMLAQELADLVDSEFDATLTGFSDSEIAKILDPGEAPAIAEIHTGPVTDRFWISIRGPLEHQAAVLDVVKAAVDKIFDVELDVGAVALGN